MGHADPGAALGTATDRASRSCCARQRAGPADAGPQRASNRGLPPDTVLYYRFMLGDAVSPLAHSHPAAPDQPGTACAWPLRPASALGSGCLALHAAAGGRGPDRLRGRHIYESGAYPPPRCPKAWRRPATSPATACTLRDAQREPTLQAAHAAVPWLLTWDDPRVMNDYAGGRW